MSKLVTLQFIFQQTKDILPNLGEILCQKIMRHYLLLGLLLAVPKWCYPASCTLTATPVAFGSYNPFNTTPTTSTGQVSITCTLGSILYTLMMNSGSAASFTPRQMQLGAYSLNYNLYTDPAYTLIWGDGTNGTVYPSSLILSILCTSLTPCNYTVYGQIPASQTNVIAGTYNDTITVTLSY